MKPIFLTMAAVAFTWFLYSTSAKTLQQKPDKQTPHPGKKIYDKHCLACHQSNGKGVAGLNPPLTGTEWVNGNKTRLINVLLKGLNEYIEINGETYSNAMPSHSFLTDQEIADVLTFVRSNFGNKASPVTATEVKKVRTGK